MHDRAIPPQSRDYGLIYIAEVQFIIAWGPHKCPRIEPILGQSVDNSEWLDFKFYDLVWYCNYQKVPWQQHNQNCDIGLGLHIASELAWLIAQSTVQHAMHLDACLSPIAKQVLVFYQTLTACFSSETNRSNYFFPITGFHSLYFYTLQRVAILPEMEYRNLWEMSDSNSVKPDVDDTKTYDELLHSEFFVNSEGNMATAWVLKRSRTDCRDLLGKHYSNRLYDTCEYDCILNDGTMQW